MTLRLVGIILAAGRGKRFGLSHKLMAQVRGKPMLFHVVEEALGSKLWKVFVVLGYGRKKLESLLCKNFSRAIKSERLRILFNPKWRLGKASSRAFALKALPREAPGAMFLLADMPFVDSELINRVIAGFFETGKVSLPVYFPKESDKGERSDRGDRRLVEFFLPLSSVSPLQKRCWGHPIVFPRSYFSGLLKLKGDESGLDLVRSDWQCHFVRLNTLRAQRDIDFQADLLEENFANAKEVAG